MRIESGKKAFRINLQSHISRCEVRDIDRES
jgi:hypothetical protein